MEKLNLEYEIVKVYSDVGGFGVKINCPDCGDEIILSEFKWWGTVCGCGHCYDFDVIIERRKENK